MPRGLTILLPPSEGKAEGGGEPAWSPGSGTQADLAGPRAEVAAALVRAKGGDQRLLGARGDLLARARAANRAVVGAPTLPAHQRFTGVVWEHLGPADLPAEARRRARGAVLVLTALTGVTAWDDPVPDFRLKLSASLLGLGRLDAFWRPHVSAVLDRRLAGRTVVDLLPQEHRAAWDPDPARYRLLRPTFTDARGRPAGHWGKAAKGRLARALLETTDVDEALAGFDPGDLRLEVDEVGV